MLYIKKANYDDIEEEFNLFSSLPYVDKGFRNYYYGIPREEFRDKCLDFIINLDLLTEPKGPYTPQTTYFLWLDNKIIGIFTVMHELSEFQKAHDGHIAYEILKEYRGQGYATKGLSLVIKEALNYIKEDEIYMHTTKDNPESLKVMLNNGAYISSETERDYFTRIKIK